MKYDLFVDETCHLEKDNIPIMCIGYMKVPHAVYAQVRDELNQIKKLGRHGMEIKWNKFSNSRMSLYTSLVDYFFERPIEFRCVLIKYKDRLKHEEFNQGSHDNFYYKMTFFLLRPNPSGVEYRVFLDIKDTRGKEKLNKIKEVFCNYHHGDSPFIHFQHIRSSDNVLIQLTDLFIGAVAYKTRRAQGLLPANSIKDKFIDYLESKSGYSLNESTPLWESKFNIFDQQPKNLR